MDLTPQRRAARWTDLGLIVLSAAAIFLIAHFPAFTNPYVINDDVRQQIYWMQQWQNPELFQHDLLTEYARHYVPWGVKGLYWLVSGIIGPLLFSKVLPGLLFVFLSLIFYLIGLQLSDRRLAWITVTVFWLMPFFIYRLSGGLARAFAAPLLAAFLLAWLAVKPWGMGLTLLGMALFIPYLFPVAAGAALLAWANSRFWKDPLPPFPRRGGHFVWLALTASLVFLFNHHLTASGFGPLVSAADMAGRPEFTYRGRYSIIPVRSIFWELVSPWESIAPFPEAGIFVGALVCILLAGLIARGLYRLERPGLIPRLRPLWHLTLASLACYVLARIFLLKLFVPDRYLTYTLNLVFCLGMALSFYGLSQKWQLSRRQIIGLFLLAVGLSCGRLRMVGLHDYSEYQPLFASLAHTPKDALVAAHPYLADNIPTFARRRAFVTYELAHPWSKGYWQKLQPRLQDFFEAYYASDPQVVQAFCEKHRISYLAVDTRHFTPAFLADSPFFAPFDERIRRLARRGQPFILLSAKMTGVQKININKYLWLLDMRPRQGHERSSGVSFPEKP